MQWVSRVLAIFSHLENANDLDHVDEEAPDEAYQGYALEDQRRWHMARRHWRLGRVDSLGGYSRRRAATETDSSAQSDAAARDEPRREDWRYRWEPHIFDRRRLRR